jgi:hypothetical protein
MLKMEAPLGEILELDFTLPFGPVTIYAAARQRNAFRYGFQFLELDAVNEVIRSTCRQLALNNARIVGQLARQMLSNAELGQPKVVLLWDLSQVVTCDYRLPKPLQCADQHGVDKRSRLGLLFAKVTRLNPDSGCRIPPCDVSKQQVARLMQRATQMHRLDGLSTLLLGYRNLKRLDVPSCRLRS